MSIVCSINRCVWVDLYLSVSEGVEVGGCGGGVKCTSGLSMPHISLPVETSGS